MNSAPAPLAPLVDPQGRTIRYVRLSLTDHCNFQCSYCSPGAKPSREQMGREEVRRLVSVLATLGIERVRLTGGEPTLRHDIVDVVRDVASIPGIQEIALTTNGHLLHRLAVPLREAGVARLNVSLDTLDPVRMKTLSGPGADLDRIVRGLEAAGRAGYLSLKLNTVVMKGVNDLELGAIARFAWRHGAIARFIELMPFGAAAQPVPVKDIERLLEEQGIRLTPDATRGWGPARHMRGEAGEGTSTEAGLLGFIGAMTENFCAGCNRIRVGADGALRSCLGGRDRVPLLDLLRSGAADAEIAARVRQALSTKGERHDMAEAGPAKRLLPMIGTGG
ncbi:MAG TPA: GTP 3',8-cyclase MoaA [Anaeromyxobacteraceae bacterium]|nr:GTP 3',8-cyclase MoaA [Anaeromyxobacteraceae bacterium]